MSASYLPYLRHASANLEIVLFGRWDDNGDYIRKYVPELKDMPKKYIYEPHKAPIQDQRKAHVLITGDGADTEQDGLAVYPKPMFDFPQQRDICLEGMKNAYKIGLNGNDPKVLDGTWRELFADDAEGPTQGSVGGPGGLMTFEDAEANDDVHDEPTTPRKAVKKEASQSTPKSARGHKREHSQGTLDGVFRKKAKD